MVARYLIGIERVRDVRLAKEVAIGVQRAPRQFIGKGLEHVVTTEGELPRMVDGGNRA